MAGVRWERYKPGIYRRLAANGRDHLYRVVYRDGTGRQITKNFPRAKDAEDFKATKRTNREPDAAAGRRTLEQVYEELLGSKSYAAATRELYGSIWRLYVRDPLGDRQVRDITRHHLEDVMGAIKAPVMRNRPRTLIGTLFTFAVRRQYVGTNPTPHVAEDNTREGRLRRAPQASQAKKYLTPEEVANLAAGMDERWRAAVYLMAYQGPRPGEAFALTVGKFDPIRRTLTIDTSLSGATKTGEARTLTLTTPIAEMLVAHLADFSDPTDPDAPMFPREDGKPIDGKNAYDWWRRSQFYPAANAAGLDDISPHALRHSAASFLIHNGATVYDVQRALGHAKASMTLDIYGELWERSGERLAEAMEPFVVEALAVRPSLARVVPIRSPGG